MQDNTYYAGYISDSDLTLSRRTEPDMFMFQWLSMWYHSALSLGLVDVTARSDSHISVLIFAYIINAIFNAILFGIYFDLIVVANRRQNEF